MALPVHVIVPLKDPFLSPHLVDGLEPGTVVRLAAPQGNFVLPDPAPSSVLFLAAGSGVTPILSMLRTLDRLRPLLKGIALTDAAGEPLPQPPALVRAKTGTLTGVHGLAGVADDPSGGRTAFVVVTDRAPADGELDARVRVDRIAAALGACRCGVGSAS